MYRVTISLGRFSSLLPLRSVKVDYRWYDFLSLQYTFFIQIVEFPRGIVSNLEFAVASFVVQLSKLFPRVERSRIEGFLAFKFPHLGFYGPIEVSLFVIGLH